MANSTTNQKRPHVILVWISLVLVIVSLFVVRTVFDRHWPPGWMERRTQREFVFTNIEAAGGWSAFKSECDSLISQSRTSGQFQWFMPFGKFPDSLIGDKFPASYKIISKLKPTEVDVACFSNKPAYVTIRVFGMHRTGGHDTPMYFLVYQQVTNTAECVAPNLFPDSRAKKLSDSIFEVY